MLAHGKALALSRELSMSVPYRFIIADDDCTIADLVEQLLHDDYPSATITCTANGRDALLAYTAGGADLLLLDINMPLLTGPHVVKIVRERGDTVPIILISAGNNAQLADASDPYTVFCAKPFDVLDLLDTIARVLGTAA